MEISFPLGTQSSAIRSCPVDYNRPSGRTAALQSARHTDDADLGVAGLRLAEPVRAVLASFGLDDARVQVAHRIFSGLVFGLLRTEEGPDDLHQAIALLVTGLDSATWPR